MMAWAWDRPTALDEMYDKILSSYGYNLRLGTSHSHRHESRYTHLMLTTWPHPLFYNLPVQRNASIPQVQKRTFVCTSQPDVENQDVLIDEIVDIHERKIKVSACTTSVAFASHSLYVATSPEDLIKSLVLACSPAPLSRRS